jgi:ADP-heptose:LPS heptosyltransferase
MVTPVRTTRWRWLLLRSHVAGVVHYCLPTLLLGAILRVCMRSREAQAQEPRSIVIFRLDRIGDLILSSAMIRELRKLYREAHITAVVSAETQALIEHCPYVDEVVAKTGCGGSFTLLFGELATTFAFCRRHLSWRRWDLAIVPRWDADVHFATLMSCYTGATRRVAFSEKSSPVKRKLNWNFNRFFSDVLPAGALKHEAERNLDVVRHLGGRVTSNKLELWLRAADEEDAARRWVRLGLSKSDIVIAFGIGAGHERRRWPVASFAELIDRLASTLTVKAVLVCGPQEHHIARAVQSRTRSQVHFLENTSLRQSAAFVSRCSLFVGNDSGPMHIAAAAGIPVVEISCHPVDGDPNGENSPHRFGPFTPLFRVARPDLAKYPCKNSCSFEQPHCITQVSVPQVEREVIGLLAETTPEREPTCQPLHL